MNASPGQALTTSLTDAEADQLALCEAVVDEGLRTFVEVGQALMRIRNERLYRASHQRFEDYVADRFGIGRAYAYRMIGAAAVAASPIGDKITNEAQARELVPLLDDPDRLREVVERVEATGKITATGLRRAIAADSERPAERFVRDRVIPALSSDSHAIQRGGATKWSRQVQTVSAKVPMDDLTIEEIEELDGAVTFLHSYCQGALTLRGLTTTAEAAS